MATAKTQKTVKKSTRKAAAKPAERPTRKAPAKKPAARKKPQQVWTSFMDMHSGGGRKEAYNNIYIEAPEEEACVIFYNRFGHSPHRVTCTCCGPDYSVHEEGDLAQATAYHRNCAYDKVAREYVEKKGRDYPSRPYLTMEQYSQQPNVLVIRKSDIQPGERNGKIPQQGFVWVD